MWEESASFFTNTSIKLWKCKNSETLLFEEEKIREWFGKFCNPHNQQKPEMPKLDQIRLKTSDHFIAKVYFKKSSSLTQLILFRENILLYYKVVIILISV